MSWNNLSLREKAGYIRVGVKNGLNGLEEIKNAYHSFADGGPTDFKTEEDARAYAAQYPNAGIFAGSNREGERYNRTYPLDEVVIRGRDLSKPYNSAFDYSGAEALARDGLGMVPYIGDALDIKDVLTDAYKGNYTEAGLGAAALLLPNAIEKPLKVAAKRGKRFVSELDWSPESWFSYRPDKNYTDVDVKELKSHLKEYKDIEKQLKESGEWENIPKDMDPREYVMSKSKNAAYLRNEPIYNGTHPEWGDDGIKSDFIGEVWGSSNPDVGRSYTSDEGHLFKLYYPKGQKVFNFDAKGAPYFELDYKGKTTTTDELKDAAMDRLGVDVVKIHNVQDQGIESVIENPKDDFIGTDYILRRGLERKSLLGNNGAININDRNMFRAAIPLVGIGAATSLYNNEKACGGKLKRTRKK